MRTLGSQVGLALGLGGALGGMWWGLYTPAAHPLGLVMLGHALAGAGLALGLWVLRLRSGAAVGGALLLALGGAPAWLRALHEAGVLGGRLGVVMDAFTLALCAGIGGALGQGLASRGARRLLSLGLAVGLVGAGVLSARQLLASVSLPTQPKAATVAADFPARKVAVIGLDGADWAVVRPLIAAGRMPNLGALLSRGRGGVLHSLVPTFSPVVWTTIFSGQPPEVHGLVDWYSADARSRRVPMLWDLFGAHGRSSLTVNIPGSWPPAEIDRGTLLSGFPIPGLTTGDKGQVLGLVASTEDETGALPTERVSAQGEGQFTLDLPLAAPDLQPRLAGVRHQLLDLAVRKGALKLRGTRLRLSAAATATGVTLSGPGLAAPVAVARDTWSGWIQIQNPEIQAMFQVYVLEASESSLRLFLTPAFQAPWAPRFPFATGIDPARFRTLPEPYVVEGLGWRAYKDPRVAWLVPDATARVEHGHTAAVETLYREQHPDLLSYVITLPDRIQHPFWPLHAPDEYDEVVVVPPHLEKIDPVLDAYATSDRLLGQVLALLPADALVFVVSDHGFTHATDKVEGEHRLEGIWVAAGPMIAPDPAPMDLSVADIVPTVLHCLGAPLASDFGGRAAAALCPSIPPAPAVATYRLAGDEGPTPAARIDKSREDQLKAMGYLDEDEDKDNDGEKSSP